MREKGRHRSHQQKHNWAFQEMLSCGHCGCAMVAEIKKNHYVYYHCTKNRGKCPEKWVREEEVARQFGRSISAIKIDKEVLDWVVTALKESHADEMKYHMEIINALQTQSDKIRRRLNAMYMDKLDGRVDEFFFDQKSKEWKKEQYDIFRKIEHHQRADRLYMDEGVKLLELAQRAVTLYEKQNMREKRRIINFVCSNSPCKDGRLLPNYRKPFDILSETNRLYKRKKAIFSKKNDHFDIWLLG
jgi:site-specific DNA recombinase